MELEQEVTTLKRDVAELKQDIKVIKDILTEAKGVLKFLRVLLWASSIIAAVAAFFHGQK